MDKTEPFSVKGYASVVNQLIASSESSTNLNDADLASKAVQLMDYTICVGLALSPEPWRTSVADIFKGCIAQFFNIRELKARSLTFEDARHTLFFNELIQTFFKLGTMEVDGKKKEDIHFYKWMRGYVQHATFCSQRRAALPQSEDGNVEEPPPSGEEERVKNLNIEMSRDCYPSTEETFIPEESKAYEQSLQAGDNLDSRGMSAKLPGSLSSSGLPQLASQNFNSSADSYNEQSQNVISLPQFLNMQETMNQIMVSQKEMQKQLSNAVNNPVIKEGQRLEVALGRMIERSSKSSADALWARSLEETVKSEKAMRDHSQQIVNATTNFMSKELNAVFEKTVKKEFAAIVPPANEKTVSYAITESFERGLTDKAINQLDRSVNSKIEATIARQIQTQFQTSGIPVLQEALRSGLEASLIPSFDRSCKTMFEQVDTALQKGIAEHSNVVQQRFDSGHSQLTHTLKETVSSASSVAQALSRELAQSQRNHLAVAAGGSNPLVTQVSNGSVATLLEKVEAPMDPMTELSRLMSERKYEESFTSALQRSDVSIVSWLCSQVDLHRLLAINPLPLSQSVLLSLLQQLACDISKDTSRKLAWMTDVVAAINPSDQMIAVHARAILEQVYQILHHQLNAPGSDVSAIRLIMHVLNSICK